MCEHVNRPRFSDEHPGPSGQYLVLREVEGHTEHTRRIVGREAHAGDGGIEVN